MISVQFRSIFSFELMPFDEKKRERNKGKGIHRSGRLIGIVRTDSSICCFIIRKSFVDETELKITKETRPLKDSIPTHRFDLRSFATEWTQLILIRSLNDVSNWALESVKNYISIQIDLKLSNILHFNILNWKISWKNPSWVY